jgi:uncharacterized iron-regulated membrane protein
MTFVERWVRQPQGLWVRKALFQVHLWTGIGVGLYVLLISVSGSVLVYRVELFRAFSKPTIVVPSGDRLTPEDLKQAAERAYPGYRVADVWQSRNLNQAAEITLERGKGKRLRLFHPYTGEDLGNKLGAGYRVTQWLLDLHDNLLYGDNGRLVNGAGGMFVIVLCLTGVVIWWPGIKNWRRSLTIEWKANWKRLNWDLHSAVGFWTIAFVFLWGISGVYLAFARQLAPFVDYFDPINELQPAKLRRIDTMLASLSRLHFGRAYGRPVKVLWAVLGLVPLFLFVTGALMWWNRVLRHGPRQSD